MQALVDGEWVAAWQAWKNRRQREMREREGGMAAPPPGELVRMPDRIDERMASEYRGRMRSIEAVVSSREIAERYPFAGAIPYLNASKFPIGSLFAGEDGGGGSGDRYGRLFESAALYVVDSIAYGRGKGGSDKGGGDNGGGGGNRGRTDAAGGWVAGVRARPHAELEEVEVDGAPYCGEAVTHALALLLAHMCGPTIAAKFAMGNAAWAMANMREDIAGDARISRPARFVREFLWCLMPHDEAGSGGSGGGLEIALPSYLARSVQIADPAWKLVNRTVQEGRVAVSRRELVRLARSDVFGLIERDVAAARVDRGAARSLAAAMHVVKRRAYNTGGGMSATAAAAAAAGTGEWPPCVMAAIDSLRRAENLPHHGRLLVAAYLLKAGVPQEEIASLFVNAPDYSEAVTRGQVAHIAGVGYMPQSCEKLESLGLCRREAACGTIKNPIQFKRPPKSSKKDSADRQK